MGSLSGPYCLGLEAMFQGSCLLHATLSALSPENSVSGSHTSIPASEADSKETQLDKAWETL